MSGGQCALEVRDCNFVPKLFDSFVKYLCEVNTPVNVSSNPLTARIQAVQMQTASAIFLDKLNPFERMKHCRDSLNKLDKVGWCRSFHQRQFHEDFLRACTRSFWKMEKPGQFARDHQKILVDNSWDHLAQEILISTPRRFGKTISVSMFAAALIVSCPGVEISIYSTCKRISQKLLRNVQKFVMLICEQNLESQSLRVHRQNMEEIVLQGPLGMQDIRVINSYPSKVIYVHVCQKSSLFAFIYLY